MFSLALLLEIATEENDVFWYEQIGFYCSFCLSYIDGSSHTALYFFHKALEKEPNNLLLLEAILDFNQPPEKILNEELKLEIAKRILQIEPANERATSILNNV